MTIFIVLQAASPYTTLSKSGNQIVVHCYLPSGYKFQNWITPSNKNFSADNGRYQIVRHNESQVTLTVRNATASDYTGTYHCTVSK